jgi:hypothetical protein
MKVGVPILVAASAFAMATPPAVVLAAGGDMRPVGSTTFSGTGKLCEDYAPTHPLLLSCRGARASFSFESSASGTGIVRFHSQVGPLYCTGGSVAFSAGPLPVLSGGSFSADVGPAVGDPSKGATLMSMAPRKGGERVLLDQVRLRGAFSDARTAEISYELVVSASKLRTTSECRAGVVGTAHAA